MTSRKILIYLAFISAALLLTGLSSCGPDHEYYVNVARSGEGWGYDVLHSGKVIIHQPYIPALPGNHPFTSRSAARKTGRLVADRLERRLPPRISVIEMDSIIRLNR